MFTSDDSPKQLVEKLGLAQISDESALYDLVKSVLDANPQSIADYKAGRDRALGFLMGQAMKLSKRKANPPVINKILKEMLDKS